MEGSATPARAGPSRGLWAAIAVFVLAVAAVGYALIGTPDYRRQLENPALLADAAEALAMEEGRSSLGGEPLRLVERALALDPNQPKALALAGAAAFDRQDFAAAVRYWERLVAVSPADADYLPPLRQAIAQARQRGGLGAAPAGSASAAAVPR